MQTGTLYICATPIGNLEDITYRVVRTLGEVDLIAAEDTRGSLKLLNHFDIHTPMTSYHEYNKYDKAVYLVRELLAGKSIALITDAGTPGISDPGEELVRQAVEAGVTVTSLPGAAACITALTISALPTRRFAFEAFLPAEKADKKERRRILGELAEEAGIRVRLVSGVTSFSACAAALGISLTKGRSRLHILPGREASPVEGTEDTEVYMKSGHAMPALKKELIAREKSGEIDVKAVSNCGLPTQIIARSAEEIPDDAGYFSLLIAREKHRSSAY